MESIIHTEADGDYNIGADNEVNADVPEVKKSNNINQSNSHSTKNHQGEQNIRQHDNGHNKDAA